MSSTNCSTYTDNIVYKSLPRLNFSSYSPVGRQLTPQNNSYHNTLQDFYPNIQNNMLLQQQLLKQNEVLLQNLINQKSRSCSRDKYLKQLIQQKTPALNINLVSPVALQTVLNSQTLNYENNDAITKLFEHDNEKVCIFLYILYMLFFKDII